MYRAGARLCMPSRKPALCSAEPAPACIPAQPGPPVPTEPGRPARTDSGRKPHTTPPVAEGRATPRAPSLPALFAEPASASGARPAPPGGPSQQSPPCSVRPERRRHSLPPAPVPPGRTRRRRPLNWVAPLALVLLAAIGYLAYNIFAGSSQATNSAHSAPARPATSPSAVPSSPAPTQAQTPSPSPKPTPRVRALAPAGAQALGIGGQSDDAANAHLAIDRHPGTAWHTDWYTTAAFGNLYAGTGLLVDMGRPVTITTARIRFGPGHGGAFRLRVGNRPSLAGLRPVAHGGATGVARLRLASPARGRYVLIWFTSLPVDPSGTFRASVYDVRLQGRKGIRFRTALPGASGMPQVTLSRNADQPPTLAPGTTGWAVGGLVSREVEAVREIVAIWYRGSNYQIGRGRDFYGIWPAAQSVSQPLESWPLTREGWYGAWSRFTTVEAPGTIVQAGAPARTPPGPQTAAPKPSPACHAPRPHSAVPSRPRHVRTARPRPVRTARPRPVRAGPLHAARPDRGRAGLGRTRRARPRRSPAASARPCPPARCPSPRSSGRYCWSSVSPAGSSGCFPLTSAARTWPSTRTSSCRT